LKGDKVPLTRPFRQSLAARLALVFGLVSLLVVTLMGLTIYGLTARYLHRQAEDDLAILADFYAAYASATAPEEGRLAALAPQFALFVPSRASHSVRLFSARNGSLLAATRDLGPLPSRAALVELGYRRPTLFLAASEDQPNRLYAVRPVTGADGSAVAVLEVSRDVGELESFLSTLRLVLTAAGGLALMAALVASLWLARQVAQPLRRMEAATEVIASGDFDRRLPIAGEDEVGRLASSINHMAADLARLEAARRDFIARVSHDLRTPLTAIKGFIVNLQDTAPEEMQASLATMDQQTERLIRLVNDLLTLSRLQRGELHLQVDETDLRGVARSAVSLASEKAQRLGVTLILDPPGELDPVLGDADRLQQVAVNLLDNALRATPAGGTVRVQVAATGSELALTVTDDGRGLVAEEAERAFEPYYRGPDGGAGLGLTIAREIVTAHGGRIWLSNRPEGGAEAGFALPFADPR
jgi:signal transduction histidine kinase